MSHPQVMIPLSCFLLSGVLGASSARADSDVEVAKKVPTASKAPRMISIPTAWMPRAGELHLNMGLDQNQKPTGAVSIGLGSLAELGLQLQRDSSDCVPCADEELDRSDRFLATGFFKVGIPEGLGGTHLPAVAVVFRKALPRDSQMFTDPERFFSRQEENLRMALLSGLVSKSVGPVALHLGVDLLVAEGEEGEPTLDADDGFVRPIAGLQWRPKQYPQTTLLADLRFTPDFVQEEDGAGGEWTSRWSSAWGVRYQAMDWAAVDLNVRRNEGDGLGDAQVTLGVRGTFDLTGAPPDIVE